MSELQRIEKMPISELSKQRLQDSLATQPNVLDHLVVIDSCVDHAELRKDLRATRKLLEYRRDVMLDCATPELFSERDHEKLLVRIQSLTTLEGQRQRRAREEALSAQRTPIQLLVEEKKGSSTGRRSTESRGRW